jgi:hypothetical protein
MNNYEYGFITKCAEYGVDPRALIKRAAPLKRKALEIALRGINDPGKRKLARQILNNSKINTKYVNIADVWGKLVPEFQAAGFTDDIIQATRGNLKGGGVFKAQANALHNLRNQMKIPTGQSMNTALEFMNGGWGPVGTVPNGGTTIGGAAKQTGKVRPPKQTGKGRIPKQPGQPGQTPNVGPSAQPSPTPNVGATNQQGPAPKQPKQPGQQGPTPNAGPAKQPGPTPNAGPVKSERETAIELIMKTRKMSREQAEAFLDNGLIRPQDKFKLWYNGPDTRPRKKIIRDNLIAGGVGLGAGGTLGYMLGRPSSQDSN